MARSTSRGCSRCDAASIETYLGGIALPLPLAQEIRLGSEFQVNTYTINHQTYPWVAADTGGDFTVAWASFEQDGSVLGDGVFERRFSASGAPLAAEFQVNVFTESGQTYPTASAASGGGFVVEWQSFGQDGAANGIFARFVSSAGAPLGGEFQLNAYTGDSQRHPSAAARVGANFVVAWDSNGQDGSGYGVFARRFSSTGAPLASEFQVNSFTPDSQLRPSLAARPNGDFVVAWQGAFDGSSPGIFARRFSSAGAPIAAELQVNTHTEDGQYRASVAVDADGDFVVAWDSLFQDGSGYGVFARRFSSAGVALASEFQVNTYTASSQHRSAVAADPAGSFVIVWQSYTQDGSKNGVFARRFSSSGVSLAAEFQVNLRTAEGQGKPSVVIDHGRFVVAWHSGVQDGSAYGIFAQRFQSTLISADIDGNGAADPLTDGLLALRYLFGFRGVALITGAVGSGCTRCDAPAIEAYLASLTS